MNFIKKIIDGKVDELVHFQFQKFSKGEFRDRAMILGKKMGGQKYSLSLTAEFGNDLVRDVAEKIGGEKTKVSGAIVSTADLAGELDFKDKKQFQGVKRYLIDTELSGKDIINLLNKFPKAFFGLSFKTEGTELKIKPKAPKSGKPSPKGDSSPKIDFCKLKTDDRELAKSYVFEDREFKEILVNHTFFIDKIVIPEELKKEKDFALIREKALRKGRIIRNSEIDGSATERTIEFEA